MVWVASWFSAARASKSKGSGGLSVLSFSCFTSQRPLVAVLGQLLLAQLGKDQVHLIGRSTARQFRADRRTRPFPTDRTSGGSARPASRPSPRRPSPRRLAGPPLLLRAGRKQRGRGRLGGACSAAGGGVLPREFRWPAFLARGRGILGARSAKANSVPSRPAR